MKKSRFTDSQIIDALKRAEAGMTVPELCRELGISSATFYKWRAKFGGMDASLMAQSSLGWPRICTTNCRRKKVFPSATSSECWLFIASIPLWLPQPGAQRKCHRPWHNLPPAKKCHRLWHKAARHRGWRQMAHRCLLLMFCCPCRGATMPS